MRGLGETTEDTETPEGILNFLQFLRRLSELCVSVVIPKQPRIAATLLLLAVFLVAAAPPPPKPWLAVLAGDEMLLLEPEEMKVAETIGDLDEPKAFSISPDHRWLAATRPGRDQLQLVDLKTKKLTELEGPALLGPVGVAFSHDGQKLYVLSSTLKALVELEPGIGRVNRVLALLGPAPTGLVARPGSDTLLVVSEVGYLAEVDARSWRVVRHDTLADRVAAVDWAGDDLLVATPSAVKFFDPGREGLRSLPEAAVGVTGPGLVLTRQELIRVEPTTGQVVWRLAVGSHPVGVASSADGRWAYVADSEARDLQVVDLEAGAERTRVALKRVPTGLRWIP